MTTIVTAYYRFKKSKYSHQVYLDWMDNMLEIHTPMVIFTNEASKKYVIERRVGLTHLTKIIILEQSEWLTYKYISQWEKHYELDHEKYHNVDLYMIWNEKSNFLKRAIELNQFNTEYFIWCDIGCFRD